MFIVRHSANVQGIPRPAQTTPAGRPPSFDGLSIDRKADVPIGVQLAWALRTRIGDGGFGPGQRLPGMRDLAEAIGVNLNTVRAVYQRLEQEGLIESQQGSGTFVAPSDRQGTAASSIAATAARTARATGVDPREVAAALYVAPDEPAVDSERAAEPSALEQRRRLREQIAAFESALGQIEAANPGVAPPASTMGLGAGPALLGTEELEQVRTMLVRRLAIVQATIDELAEAELERAGDGRAGVVVGADARADAGETTAQTPPMRTRRPRASARALPST